MSPRGRAMNASDDGELTSTAHRTRCSCGRVFYSTGAQRCMPCRISDAAGNGATPPPRRPGPRKKTPRIVIRTYPEPYPMPRVP